MLGFIEERAGLLCGPDRDGRSPAGPLPLRHAVSCPHDGSGTSSGRELDVCGRVGDQQAAADSRVEGGHERGVHAAHPGVTQWPGVVRVSANLEEALQFEVVALGISAEPPHR
ncbi:hypothetical protein [Vallicoccus soli]|uniref:hypothetical protein n=1 Tax=Vallicoccus soli TaxID=2339232 RepID=UPI001FEC2516|nr:hypothetical protein [Vallicoccus soli]